LLLNALEMGKPAWCFWRRMVTAAAVFASAPTSN
jgi:hypothetical protein